MPIPRIIAGDSFNPPPVDLPAYPAAAGWSLLFILVPLAGLAAPRIEIACAPVGDLHQPQAAASVTASWVPGEYGWTSLVTRGGERATLERGRVVIEPDPRTATAVTHLSAFEPPAPEAPADLDLAAARAQLATWLAANTAVAANQSTTIAGRTFTRADAAVVLQQVKYWQGQVARLATAQSGRRPGPLGRVAYGVPR